MCCSTCGVLSVVVSLLRWMASPVPVPSLQTCVYLRAGAQRVNSLPPSPPILLPPPSYPPPRRTNFQKQPGQRDANKCFGQLQAGCLPKMPGPQMRHVRVQIENANFTYAATWLVTAKLRSSAAVALPGTCRAAGAVPLLLWVWLLASVLPGMYGWLGVWVKDEGRWRDVGSRPYSGSIFLNLEMKRC